MQLPTPSQSPKGLLPKGSRLRGELNVAQGLRIEGEVLGNVRATDGDGATVIVAEGATVVGAIQAAHVVVQGQVQGPIVALQSLQLQAGAHVEGELHYLHLDLHPQALVRGSLNPILGMAGPDADPAPPPAAEAAAPAAEPEAKGPADDAVNAQGAAEPGGEPVPSSQTHM
jgi:cytoskeletal protein CcmA (bactofilin family)